MKASRAAIKAALKVDPGIGQGASHDHARYIYINAVLEAAYGIELNKLIGIALCFIYAYALYRASGLWIANWQWWIITVPLICAILFIKEKHERNLG